MTLQVHSSAASYSTRLSGGGKIHMPPPSRPEASQRPRQPEHGEHAVIEPGHGADLLACQRKHQQPVRVRDAGVRVWHVEAEGRLAVGPGRHQPVAAAGREDHRAEKAGHQVAALVFGRRLRGAKQHVVGEHGDELVDAPGFVGAGEYGRARLAEPGGTALIFVRQTSASVKRLAARE
jgi:hypothetical protein